MIPLFAVPVTLWAGRDLECFMHSLQPALNLDILVLPFRPLFVSPQKDLIFGLTCVKPRSDIANVVLALQHISGLGQSKDRAVTSMLTQLTLAR